MRLKMIFSAGVALSLAGIFSSCDNVDLNDRYEVTDLEITDKTLLIMEFTGLNCVNCPTGAAAIHSIQEMYNTENETRVIAVGLHPEGGGANTRPLGGLDLRCEEAQVMFNVFNKPDAFPTAVFNGTIISSVTQSWMTSATNMLIYNPSNPEAARNEPRMRIDATTDYNSSNRNLKVNYDIKITKDINEPLNVMVWIMENGIVGYQMDGGKLITNYVHNHVLRASLNGNLGEALPTGLGEGEEIEGTAEMTVDENWVAENCQIVVFVFNSSDYFVEQAALADID